jgi:hypothetical protein
MWAIRSALKLLGQARSRGRLYKLWSILTRRSGQLLDLNQIEAHGTVRNRYYAGIQTIPLRQIRGSAGRCQDFDVVFHPRGCHNQWRWLNIAATQHMGLPLPPVQLIQVGEIYFVEDGHHRVSVARAKGQTCIEAEVVVWEVANLQTWQQPTTARRRTPALGQRQQPVSPVGTS